MGQRESEEVRMCFGTQAHSLLHPHNTQHPGSWTANLPLRNSTLQVLVRCVAPLLSIVKLCTRQSSKSFQTQSCRRFCSISNGVRNRSACNIYSSGGQGGFLLLLNRHLRRSCPDRTCEKLLRLRAISGPLIALIAMQITLKPRANGVPAQTG